MRPFRSVCFGDTCAIGFLRGQVMKVTGGKADPKLVGKLIEDRLTQIRGAS